MRSRPGRDCSNQFPELASFAGELRGRDVLVDGELVCLDADGRPDFHRLRRRLSAGDATAAARLASEHPATLMVFDLLHLDGHVTRNLAYSDHRVLFEHQLPAAGPSWRFPAPLTGELESVLTVTRTHQLEGIVAKRLDAPYTPGHRSAAWLKHKHRRRETFAVTGWRPAPMTGRRLDTVFIARADRAGSLQAAGSAELGLRREDRDRLRAALEQRSVSSRRGGHRVTTGIWLEIDFHGAPRGPLRDPVMRELRLES